jgi:hypothetical protein
MAFPANWRLEGGQYLPNMPGLLMNAGAPQIVLWFAAKLSFLPSVLCLPTDAPCTGAVALKVLKATPPVVGKPLCFETVLVVAEA